MYGRFRIHALEEAGFLSALSGIATLIPARDTGPLFGRSACAAAAAMKDLRAKGTAYYQNSSHKDRLHSRPPKWLVITN